MDYTRLSRRSLLTTCSVSLLVPTISTGRVLANTPPAKHLVRHREIGSLDLRTKIVVELEGKLQLKPHAAEQATKPREAEIKAKSTLDYFERAAFDQGDLIAAERQYVEAVSENWIEGSAAKQSLRSECHTTHVMKHDATWQQYCPNEPLNLRETQLLQSPVNSGSLELLLPTEPATANAEWSFEDMDLCNLLNLEAVHENDVRAKVTKVEKGTATVEIKGNVNGTANSVPTQLHLNGNYRVQFGQQCALITWVGLSVKENREISEAEPGFSIVARVRLIRMETEPKISTSEAKLRKIAQQQEPGLWLVRITSPQGGFSMLGDRRWRTFVDSREQTILRFIEKNTIIAQCNITRLTSLSPGKQVTLEGMQADIKRSLGDKFEEFIETDERVTSSNLRLVRSVVSGRVEEVPVQWIHNHLSNDLGERIAMVFTLGGNMVEQFAGNDIQMASSFQMIPLAATESQEASQQSAQAQQETRR